MLNLVIRAKRELAEKQRKIEAENFNARRIMSVENAC